MQTLELKPLTQEIAQHISGYSDFNFELQKDFNNQKSDIKEELLTRFINNVFILVSNNCPLLMSNFSVLFDVRELNSFAIFELGFNDQEKVMAECCTAYNKLTTDIKTISFAISLMAWNKITWDIYEENNGELEDNRSNILYNFAFYMYHYLAEYCNEHYDEYEKDKNNYIIDIDSITRIRD